MLNRLENDISTIPNISIFNKECLDVSMWHGLDLVEEAHRIFPVIAGRLMFLGFQLEELGMVEEAGRINSLFEYESIDLCLDDFNRFYREYKDGKKVKPEVVMKILQIFVRIQTLLPIEDLSGILNVSLIRRVTRLFSDFLGTIQGIIPEGIPEVIDLIPILQKFIISGNSSGVSDSELICAVDDEKLYRQAMVNRLAHYPHTLHISYRLRISDDTKCPILIRADMDRFYDFLAAISEYFEEISVEIVDIYIKTESDGIWVILTPEGSDLRYEVPIPGATQREVTYVGGRLMSVMEPGKEDIRIVFPSVN
ncbi:MAG: hypothetical protein CVV33_03740 [Methanomicrobiales archaeon HGW-Methanomicrobiales-4]|nr:MAG: hypothetical protein CVV33_03740 [Methanomicrobiales archaeon HGW-Methanomicrobiales-4]